MIYWHTLDFQTPQVMLEYLAIGFWNQLSLGIRLLCARSWVMVRSLHVFNSRELDPCCNRTMQLSRSSGIYRTKRDSPTTFSRFQNQNHAIPEPNHAIPKPKPARFHNYILTIPQPNSHDSTTNISGFHNQNLAILQLTTIDSTRKTAATYFHCRKFLTSYKKLKSPTPAKQ